MSKNMYNDYFHYKTNILDIVYCLQTFLFIKIGQYNVRLYYLF